MVSRPYWTFDIDRNQNTPTTATTAPRTHLSANPSNQHQAHDHVAGAVFQEAIDVAVILNALRALGGGELGRSGASEVGTPGSFVGITRIGPAMTVPTAARR